MKRSIAAHPEALFCCICDVQSLLEAQNLRCKIMVMSSLCYAALLKEDHNLNRNDRAIKLASAKTILSHGYLGSLWGSAIYIDRTRKSYDIDVYGGDCLELQIDHPDIWDKAQHFLDYNK